MSFAFPSLEEILAEHLPEDKLDKVKMILYGRPAQRLEITKEMKETSRAKDFELQKWSIYQLCQRWNRDHHGKSALHLFRTRWFSPQKLLSSNRYFEGVGSLELI